jgi:hypothetical protein
MKKLWKVRTEGRVGPSGCIAADLSCRTSKPMACSKGILPTVHQTVPEQPVLAAVLPD